MVGCVDGMNRGLRFDSFGCRHDFALRDAEFDFRYSSRKMSDTARMNKLMGQVGGKRLTYKRVTTA